MLAQILLSERPEPEGRACHQSVTGGGREHLTEEKYIINTLHALKKQTFDNLETIVVADSCTDNTRAIAKTRGCRVLEVNNRDVGKNRNQGAKHARADIIVFLDADVRVSPDYLSKLYLAVQRGCKHGRPYYYIDSPNPVVRNLNLVNNLFKMRYYPHTSFCTRELFMAIHGFPEGLKNSGEDLIYSDRLKAHSKGCMVEAKAYNSDRRFQKNGSFKEILFLIKAVFQ